MAAKDQMAAKKKFNVEARTKSIRTKKRQRVFDLVDALHTINFSRVFIEDMLTSDTYWISVYLEKETIDVPQFSELVAIAAAHDFAIALANDLNKEGSKIRLWPKVDNA